MNTNQPMPYRIPAPKSIINLARSEHYKRIVRGKLEEVGSKNLSIVPLKCGNLLVLFSKTMPTRVGGVAVVDPRQTELMNINGEALEGIIAGDQEVIEKVCKGIAAAIGIIYGH